MFIIYGIVKYLFDAWSGKNVNWFVLFSLCVFSAFCFVVAFLWLRHLTTMCCACSNQMHRTSSFKSQWRETRHKGNARTKRPIFENKVEIPLIAFRKANPFPPCLICCILAHANFHIFFIIFISCSSFACCEQKLQMAREKKQCSFKQLNHCPTPLKWILFVFGIPLWMQPDEWHWNLSPAALWKPKNCT